MDLSKTPYTAYGCKVGRAKGLTNLPWSVFAGGATELGGIVYGSAKGDVVETG